MYRGSYRLRHERTPPNELIVDPTHRPTRIIVGTMTGIQHTLFTEHDGETFLDVKNALLPYVDITPKPKPLLSQLSLSLKKADGSFDMDVEDDRVVPLNDSDVNLELLVKEVTINLNSEQRELIDKWARIQELHGESQGYVLNILDYDVNTPAKMEAFLFHLEDNPLKKLVVGCLNIMQIRAIMMTLIRNNIPIESLLIANDIIYGEADLDIRIGLSSDEMREVFDMIRQLTTLRSISIQCNRKYYDRPEDGRIISYRMNDLAKLLEQNTSLSLVSISGCHVIFDEDITRLSYTLIGPDVLERLQILDNKSQTTQENLEAFGASLRRVIPDGGIKKVGVNISFVWTRSGDTNFSY
jgi:hypothetical protein